MSIRQHHDVPNVSELIHIAQAFLQSGGTATVIAETLYNSTGIPRWRLLE
ncbi:MAG: hypothetical protein K8R59_15865 [Thermoanaerobaculales bacterium]|nr:hypothetical protein [Thermoanaerobaculales bacterium]